MVHHQGHDLVPGCLPKPLTGADQGRQDAVGVIVLQVAFDPLGTQLALIDRKIVPGLKADNPFVVDLELNAALHPAEAAVGFYQTVRLGLGVPAARRLVVQVGAKLFDQFVFG